MAASSISASTRYINKGVTKFLWVESISSLSAPTREELDAGTDLSNEIQEIEGWVVESASVETPDLGSTFTGSIPGSTSAEDSSITMYADLGGTDVRDVISRGDNGYMVIMDGGDIAGRTMDVFPARVGSLGKNRSVDDDPATITISFYITDEPVEDLAIPS
ncbi:hypothetical protein [Actinomadura sp. SCN-SB]|uniref:phage tail tube protein n=1 Tax=Actinomadura sp. SCN-SB TaxID=3373092 RepID=UPI003753437D